MLSFLHFNRFEEKTFLRIWKDVLNSHVLKPNPNLLQFNFKIFDTQIIMIIYVN